MFYLIESIILYIISIRIHNNINVVVIYKSITKPNMRFSLNV